MGGAASSQSQKQEEVKAMSNEEPVTNIRTVSEPQEQSSKSQLELPKEKRMKTPHNYDVIMREADNLGEKQHDLVYSGFFLKKKRMKYWVDEESGCNCFMLYAKELLITWSEDVRYWKWIYLKETSEVDIEVASLLNVCWLEVHGTLKKAYLTPGSCYEVVFVVMLKDPAYGWEIPINLRLVSSENDIQEHKECLLEKPRGGWFELVVGHFTVPASYAADPTGEIQFSMFEYEGGEWKRGLAVKGAIVRPKK